jgi:hypothetical protein
VPDGAVRPYRVVYTSVSYPAEDPDNAVNGRSSVREVRWIVHSVADTAESARAGAQRARTQLLDVRPTIPGLSCGLIRMDGEPAPDPRRHHRNHGDERRAGVPASRHVLTIIRSP